MNKNLIKTIVLVFFILPFVSCSKMLDTEPQGATITEKQKDENASLIDADVAGLSTNLLSLNTLGTDRHFDFGLPAAFLFWDHEGLDMVSNITGYNWFSDNLTFEDRDYMNEHTTFLWKLFYRQILLANNLINKVAEGDPDDQTLVYYRGLALANRAFAYFNLVQAYQFTYVGHENAPAVPIVTEKTTQEDAKNNPRATVAEVYKFILSDLEEAIKLLAGYARPNKSQIDQSVAYGIRARVHLVMNKWKEAAEDAAKALEGYTPYTIEKVSKPSFNNIAAESWLWGGILSAQSEVVETGIVNFLSHISSFTGNGYSPYYAARYCSRKLYDQIPKTDIRKQWWAELKPRVITSTNPETGEEKKDTIVDYRTNTNVDWTWFELYEGDQYDIAGYLEWGDDLINVKFGPYQDIYNNPTNAADIPFMRAEEMILIKAEATAMNGNFEEGKQILEEFIQEYRDPSYTCAATAENFQDTIWFQRRVELWGEGFALFDILRLKKELDRTGSNFPTEAIFKLPAESPILLQLIPEAEIDSNDGISEADNNPTQPKPIPVPNKPTPVTDK